MAKKNHYHIVLQKEDIESGLKEHMDKLAAQKKLTARIKTALTLLAELEQGNTSLLDSMFPEIRKPPAPPPAPDTSGLQREIAELKVLIIQQGAGNIIPVDAPMVGKSAISPPTKPSLTAGAGSTLGQGRKLALPLIDDDDDDDTMVINKVSVNTGANFGASMKEMGLF